MWCECGGFCFLVVLTSSGCLTMKSKWFDVSCFRVVSYTKTTDTRKIVMLWHQLFPFLRIHFPKIQHGWFLSIFKVLLSVTVLPTLSKIVTSVSISNNPLLSFLYYYLSGLITLQRTHGFPSSFSVQFSFSFPPSLLSFLPPFLPSYFLMCEFPQQDVWNRLFVCFAHCSFSQTWQSRNISQMSKLIQWMP